MRRRTLITVASLLLVGACGGGGDNTGSSATTTVSPQDVSVPLQTAVANEANSGMSAHFAISGTVDNVPVSGLSPIRLRDIQMATSLSEESFVAERRRRVTASAVETVRKMSPLATAGLRLPAAFRNAPERVHNGLPSQTSPCEKSLLSASTVCARYPRTRGHKCGSYVTYVD